TIKPSSPTPPHVRNFNFCLLDQLAPPFYVPVVLFYLGPDQKAAPDSALVSGNLKTSLAQALSLFYPLGGRVKGNAGINCNDEGALYMEAKARVELSKVLSNPDMDQLQQFLPFFPCRVSTNIDEQVIVGVQANFFDCGGMGIGICISHKIADGASVSAFLNAWSEIANNGVDGEASLITPFLKASELFQPKDISYQMPSGVISREKLSTKRFCFNGESLARLRAGFGDANPTRVEAVTALIWKSAVAAARKRPEWKEKYPPSSAVMHAVNIRSRIRPQPLPETTLGNLVQAVVAPLMEPNKDRTIAIELYRFSSWARFPFYEVDFGWGRPAWVCTTSVPIKNLVILMGTRCGDGIEAWITLAEHDMIEFEHNDELLQFVSPNP
ncbi:hypothetical protein EUGRSUZ_L02250, partial [Eucalyptus grandis]